MKSSEDGKNRTGMIFLLIFLGLAAGILAGGYFAYQNYEQSFRAEAERQLSAIAELKVNQLVEYRTERFGDASTFFKNPAFSNLVKQFFEQKNDGKIQRQLQAWLTKLPSHYSYNGLFLLDTRGVVRLSVPQNSVPIASVVYDTAMALLRAGNVTLQDFHRNEYDQRVYLTILVPIIDDADANRRLGVLLLRIDPEVYLYPFIQTWPVPSRTSETLIVRREGNDVLFLNELRFQENTALNLRIPLSNDSVAAVKAVLGQKGIVDALDYRGEPIVAEVRKVTDSPWFLVCRMDKTEIYEALRSRLWLMIALMGALLVGAGASVGLVWHQQRSRFYREQYQWVEALKRSQSLLAAAERIGKVGGWEFDIDTKKQTWTEEVCRIHEVDITYKPTVETGINFYAPAFRPIIERAVQRAIEHGEPFDVELEIITAKNNLRCVRAIGAMDQERKKVFGSFQDITDRKRAEEALHESEVKYRELFQNAEVGMYRSRLDGSAILAVNPKLCDLFGYREEEMLRNPATIRWAHADARDRMVAELRKSGSLHDYEMDILTSSGEIRCFMISVHLYPDQGYLEGSAIDITESKRAAEALATQARIANIFATSPDDAMYDEVLKTILDLVHSPFGVFGYIDEDGANVVPTMTRQIWDKCEVPEKTIRFPREAWGSSSWPRALLEKRTILSNEPSTNIPEGHVGIRRHISMPILFRGEAIGLFQVANKETDYTDADTRTLESIAAYVAPFLNSRLLRERSEKALQASEVKFRQTYDLSPVGIVMVGLDKRFRRCNDAFARFLSHLPEELVGKAIDDVTFTEDRQLGMAEMMAMVKGETKSSNVQKRYVRKDGKIVWGEVTISLVRDREEQPQYFLAIVQDVTEQRQNETELRRLYDVSEHSRTSLLSILEDQKRAEVALRLKNLVFDASISANSIADLNGVITEANEAFVRVWGYPSKDEVVGKPIPYFLNDQNEAVGIVTALNNTGQWEGDYTAKRKDGSTFIARSLATSIKDEKGKVIGYQSAVNDITALKEAEKELKKHRDNLEQLVAERTADLKKSEEKFRTVANFTYDWEYWMDADRRMLFISPSCERVTGYPPASFYEDSQFIDTIIHPDDRQIFAKHVESYHIGGNPAESCEMEFRIVDRNGCTKWIGHLCTPVTGDDGVSLGRRVSNRDMTERKMAENLTRCQRDLGIALGGKMRMDEALTMAIEAAIGISGMDCGGVYMVDEISGALDLIYHNGLPADFVASSNHFGADSSNSQIVMRGAPIYASIPALDVEKYDPEGLRAIAIIPMLVSGKVIGCMNVASHAVDEVPIETRIGLEVLTAQVSVALARMKAGEELTRQSLQLEAANKELEAFSYSVSHDLRAPLRSIDGFSQALLEDYHDKLDENGKNHLTRVRGAAQRMAQLIDDVLDLSRIHRAAMSRVSVDFTGLAKEIIEDLRETQARKNVEVVIEPGMSAVGDTQLLRLFLQNLLENAWKFTSKHDHAKIEIGSRETDGKTVFFVKDDGAGFDMAHADMLFAPFQRLHAQTEFPGTGVGLASAQRIIHRHGGKIWAESEVEKGATFFFTL